MIKGVITLGKLIVLEGLDGCGKSTQLSKLEENFIKNKIKFKTVSFPEYDEPSCEPVKMYLNGRFGKKPGDVNAYTASLFFAIDRYASFRLKWEEFYNEGGIILAGRYTTSNAIHQMSKMNSDEWEEYLNWMEDLEFNKIGIPKPDAVIFLDMPLEVSNEFLTKRYNGDETKRDIHENDGEYLKNCRKAAYFAAEKLNWQIINCAKDNKARTIDDISEEILNKVKEVIK